MNEKDLKKARIKALRLLKYRIRSKKELSQRLLLGKVPKEAVKAVVADLERLSLVNDLQFTRIWIKNRLERGFGRRRIERELLEKGISREMILDCLAQEEGSSDTLSVIKQLIEKRIGRYRACDKDTVKRRLFDYLRARGFSPEKIRLALEDL